MYLLQVGFEMFHSPFVQNALHTIMCVECCVLTGDEKLW